MKYAAMSIMILVAAAPASAGEISYDAYAEVLAAYVDDEGLVNYAALKNDRAKLDAFIESLGGISTDDFQSWSESEKIAFWINAYNAITLQYMIDHYPIKKGGFISGLRFPDNSIRQIDGVWTKLETAVLGEALTLDHIEHQILRKEFNEPRIHMALVCAALSCPKLRDEPFVGARLDDQLTEQSKHFVSSPARVRLDREKNRLYLSAIFDWFGDDFEATYTPAAGFEKLRGSKKATANFVSLHMSEEDAQYLRSGDYAIRYLDYDWTLNEQ